MAREKCSLNRYPFSSGLQFCKRSNDDQRRIERAIFRGKARSAPLLFIVFTCDSLRFCVPSDLGGVCNLGLRLVGAVANHLGVVGIVSVGVVTAGFLVILFRLIVFISLGLAFRFFLFLGRGGLGLLRRRGFI